MQALKAWLETDMELMVPDGNCDFRVSVRQVTWDYVTIGELDLAARALYQDCVGRAPPSSGIVHGIG